MKNYVKLVNFELNRFFKLYMTLVIVVFFLQTSGVMLLALYHKRLAENAIVKGGMSLQEYLETYSLFSLQEVVYSIIYLGPIVLGVTAIMLYVFFIWYRDWFAKNTFIYRLLMLPTSRMNIYFAKVTTIMLAVFGLVTFQIIFLMIQAKIVKWIIPHMYRIDYSVTEIAHSQSLLGVFIPDSVLLFFMTYAIILGGVLVIFTAILLERSYRIIGIFIGILYVSISFLLFVVPYLFTQAVIGKQLLYPDEVFFLQVFIWLIIVVISLLVSRFLINKKVTV